MSDSTVEGRKRKRDEQDQRRISHACLPCRRRKVRCSGDRPCCQNCLKVHVACQYDRDEVNNEGHKPGEIKTVVSGDQRRVLIDIFFNVPHLDIMRQSIHRLSFEGAELGQQSEFLLMSIYCLSALYVSDSDVLQVFHGETASQLSQRLANAARQYSRDTSDQPSVASTQANLLLGFRDLLCRIGYKAWMYTGIAIRMSQALRLGREYHQRHSVREQEVRRRTLWTCFIMDRLVSFVCSRPQTLRPEKLCIQLPCAEASFVFGEPLAAPISFLETGPDPGTSEVLPYFIKAIECWGRMTDVFASGVKGPPSQAPTDSKGEFYNAEAALISLKHGLPPRMLWSLSNYRAHRSLNQGSIFVSLHFVLNHALCLAHQEYLPEFEGDPAFDESSSPEPSSTRSVVRTCLASAEEITRMASSLRSGDLIDQEMLRAPFVGVALESAACCHLWKLHLEKQALSTEAGLNPNNPHQRHASAQQKIDLLCKILKSWSNVWPIASSWQETISLLSRLYQASDPTNNLEFQDGALSRGEESQPLASGDVTLGSGYPFPQNLKSQRMFDNVRMIIMTAADPPALRNHQTRLHVQNLWNRTFLQSSNTIDNFAGSAIFGEDGAENMPIFENFDDLLNFMDDFQGFENFDAVQIIPASHY